MIEELECGCEIEADFAGYGANSDMANYKNWRVNYCPMHAAAPDMLEVCEQVERVTRLAEDDTCPDMFLEAEIAVLRDKAKAVLATVRSAA